MNGATPVTTSEEHQHQHQQPQNEPPPEHPRSPTSPLSIRHDMHPLRRTVLQGIKNEWTDKIEFPLVTSVGRLFKRRFHDIMTLFYDFMTFNIIENSGESSVISPGLPERYSPLGATGSTSSHDPYASRSVQECPVPLCRGIPTDFPLARSPNLDLT
ncbi:hypothetical protein WN51_10139 [Melipona quadrifasciata]|uniref:Uncharacterized protein n=1 Tax=Melipona quadrifasciata TaxID=166423 RepID=A0A0N1IU15_9HYME|nr:hypothetical protein WN51_10139 [Melipona quadrifasciata]